MATLAGFGDSDIVCMAMDDEEMHRERLFVFFRFMPFCARSVLISHDSG